MEEERRTFFSFSIFLPISSAGAVRDVVDLVDLLTTRSNANGMMW